jgi:hypothetical protein
MCWRINKGFVSGFTFYYRNKRIFSGVYWCILVWQ